MEFCVNKKNNLWLHIGIMRGIAFGFSVNRYSFDIDFLCFYIGLEF